MSAERARLQELADQALRDIVDLDRQVADGELPEATAGVLRDRYETTAARALAALETVEEPVLGAATAKPRRSRARVAAYALAGIAAVVAAAVLLPLSVVDRPTGGFVTGNEIGASAAPPPTQPPLEALWVRANIQLHGLDDPAGALATLDRMRRRDDLTPTLAQQVDELAAVARQRQDGPGP
ncbi:MAG: hypothetical protein GEU83_11045 [Pseudonocardiaceae bacterium]|nr:hypothetical protein [Pseudonocardiaceae bacterium]